MYNERILLSTKRRAYHHLTFSEVSLCYDHEYIGWTQRQVRACVGSKYSYLNKHRFHKNVLRISPIPTSFILHHIKPCYAVPYTLTRHGHQRLSVCPMKNLHRELLILQLLILPLKLISKYYNL